jgi:alpha-N-arabinofuranosidase
VDFCFLKIQFFFMHNHHFSGKKLSVPLAPLIAAMVASMSTLAQAQANDAIPTLQIKADQVVAHVSPLLHGLMTEEINFSYEGGLYGELIRNRTFKANPTNAVYWNAVGDAAISLDTNQPLNSALNVSLKLDTSKASKDSPVGVANDGYWGIPVRPNTTYRVSFYAKKNKFNGPLTVSLESDLNTNVGTVPIRAMDAKNSKKSFEWFLGGYRSIFASAEIPKISNNWQKYEVTLTTGNVPPSKDNELVISTTKPGTFWNRHGTVWLQQVSLFPPTYHNRPNGNRPDIMQLLADMKPAFLRFPGGNYLEGNTIATRFNWKNTVGDVSQRPGHLDDGWGYWSTDGMGLLEFLEWCEDLNMQPLLAVYAGYSMRQVHVAPGAGLEPYVQDALDEIEYVTGDVNTKWGAQRAKDGHPAPFPLHYVEVGNEDWFDRSNTYDARFTQYYDAIKAKYPQLQIISTVGNEHPEAQRVHSRTPDLTDEHYYKNQEQMEAQSHMYDDRPRTGPKIFVGEWATRVGSPTPNMAGALGDAAWMTGMERNSDIVLMASYAPLFVNVSDLKHDNKGNLTRGGSMQWLTDLIGYDALTSYGSPAYYAQKMFASQCGDVVLAMDAKNVPMQPTQAAARRATNGVDQPAPATREIPSLFSSVTRDSQTGTIYLKVVNTSATPQPVKIEISGAASVETDGSATVMKASSPEDTNSINDPVKVVPVTEKIDELGTEFTREFPPCSITVLELKAK